MSDEIEKENVAEKPAAKTAGFSAKTTETNGDDLAGAIIAEMSTPTKAGRHVVRDSDGFFTLDANDEIPTEKPKQNLSKVRMPQPKPSEKFDESMHAVDADGKPKRNKDGSLQLKRGRKSASVVRDPRQDKKATNEKPVYNPKEPDNYDSSAGTYLDLGTQMIAGISGNDEFLFDGEAERESLRIPLAAAMREKGVAEMSPTMMFLCALSCYVFARIQKPKTKAIVDKILGKPEKKELPNAPDAPDAKSTKEPVAQTDKKEPIAQYPEPESALI